MSIKEFARKRLIEDVIQTVQPESGWKVLIVDQDTLRIISVACRMYDIMEEGVTLVEKIDIKRQPLPKMDAIYLLSPKSTSIDALIKDFEDVKNPQYGTAHIFFTTRVDDKEITRIKREPNLVSRVKCLKELNMDFLAYEKQTFHFDSPGSFKLLFSPESNESGAEQRRIASKLASVCATLKEYPIIRYSKHNSVSSTFATIVQDNLDILMRLSPEYAQSVNFSNRAILLISDRSQDVLAPLLHEFTYQAMIYDVLNIENDHYKFNAMTTGGENKTKEVILGETDPLWATLRHMHVADTINWILDNFNTFIQENKATKLYKKSQVNDLREMSEAMKAMPQYQEMIGKYSLHINLTNHCMSIFQEKNLAKLAAVEQDMACGEDAEGKSVKNLLSSLPPLLTDSSVSLVDKLRLLMLYIVSQEGIKDSDRKRLMELASISNDDQGCISNLRFLGVTLLKGAKAKKIQSKEKKKNKKQRSDAPPYELSRYVPQFKIIGQELIDNTLPLEEFPFVKEDPNAVENVPSAKDDVKSLRKDKAQPKWANKEKRKSEKTSSNGAKIIIFILGGMTHSEMRSAYELSKKSGREVIIGSNWISTPKEFVQNLRSLKKTETLERDSL